MQKQFSDVVILSKNGVLVPAIVIKSQLQGDGREFLSLLYADPATGPSLVLAGGTRKVGSVELSVPPLAKGQMYGWVGLVVSEKDLAAHTAAVIASKPVPEVEIDEDDLPGVHGLPSQADESEADKASRLANLQHQDPVAPAKETAPEPDPAPMDNEELAAKYIAESGKTRHTSDCATSVAPAEVPGPCNCDAPADDPVDPAKPDGLNEEVKSEAETGTENSDQK